ncbi:hypothetical protein EBR66_07170 [bacterium]|nr:hypothetical protein [bacterium]
MIELLEICNRVGRTEVSEVVYQAQKALDITAGELVRALEELEARGLVNVQVLVSLTQEGRARVS